MGKKWEVVDTRVVINQPGVAEAEGTRCTPERVFRWRGRKILGENNTGSGHERERIS